MTSPGRGLILQGGRVLDPESGLDAVTDLVVSDGRVEAVGDAGDRPGERIDVTGLAVAPGFIDLHSHAYSLAGHRLQAMDGVTTALELESGLSPVDTAYARLAVDGMPLNYGFSASWAVTRMRVVGGLDVGADMGAFLRNISDPAWQAPASGQQVEQLVDALAQELADGALGIGLLLGYAPLIDPVEYVAVARLAAGADVPTYTHARELVEVVPDTPIDGAEEIVRAAGETGAHMHYCHVNSTSRRHLDRVLARITAARAEGARVSTEAYPYGSGSTGIGAYFLHPERLPRWGLKPSSIRYMPTGERPVDEARLQQLREQDPGGLAIIDFLDESDAGDRDLLHRALLFDDTAVASDAMPLTWPTEPARDDAWPVPADAITHPRTAGTFCRSLRVLTRERGVPLLDAVRRMTLVPAQVVGSAAPAMARKGRISPGADADVVVFDPATVTDQATYDASTRPSTGIVHLLVNGEFVVRHGQLQLDSRPGRPVRGIAR